MNTPARSDLKNARVAKGLTQAQLGESIGRDQGTVSRYESGAMQVDRDVAPLLAEQLGMPLLDVLYPKPQDETAQGEAA